MSSYPTLLSPVTLGALTLPNRVIMAPMTRSRARDDGTVPAIYGDYFAQRSSAGLVITDATMVSPQAVGYLNTPGIWTDEQVEAWREVTAAVHAVGGLIVLQVMHCGRISHSALQPDLAAPVSSSGLRASATMLLTPAGVEEPASEPRALELNEIPGVIFQFSDAARRGRAAGFDAIEIHAANGYLIDQFLRDGVNQRHDRYGGSADNRARFLLQVTEAVAKEFGADRTGVRLSPSNAANEMRDGNPLETFGTAVRHLGALDLAWTHLADSGDTDLTNRLRDAHGKPFILNGGFTARTADAVIRSELAIAVSFGSLYIANPDLVERFEIDAALNSPDRATYYTGGERGFIDYPELSQS
ncbi:MAG: alkene reductase [Gemmatimonadaceae bacterium]|nr:alkene reductase [Gemmatimonadaceae bacterium]